MSVSLRYYLFDADSKALRLSQRLVDGLTQGNDSMPQYAGTRQKVMGVALDNRDGKPVEIVRSYGTIWTFDTDGEITEGLHESLAEAMNSIGGYESASAKVVSIKPQISKKRLAEKFRWEPTKADIELVVRDIWPKTKADRLQEAKGVSQPKPPLTFDGKQAITKASGHFWDMARELEGLKEPGLKGFVFEAKKRSKEELEYRHLYEALAKMGEDQPTLLARKKCGKGVWYAVIEVMVQQEQWSETIRVIRERCDGRKAAVVAARRMLAENAHLFDELVTLETSIMTDLEWEVFLHADDPESPPPRAVEP